MKRKKLLFFIEDKKEYETLWAILRQENEFVIDNIPFYIQGIAYKDIVLASCHDNQFYFEKLITPSGHSTIQIIFFKSEIIPNILAYLKEAGCAIEISDLKEYISIDIPPEVKLDKIVQFLLEKEKQNILSFREACLGQ